MAASRLFPAESHQKKKKKEKIAPFVATVEGVLCPTTVDCIKETTAAAGRGVWKVKEIKRRRRKKKAPRAENIISSSPVIGALPARPSAGLPSSALRRWTGAFEVPAPSSSPSPGTPGK